MSNLTHVTRCACLPAPACFPPRAPCSHAATAFSTPACAAAARRVAVLLTDGRVDTHQATEAAVECARLADEQRAAIFAFGVGRAVDDEALVRIIAADAPDTGARSATQGAARMHAP
jgi:hypothetical protein